MRKKYCPRVISLQEHLPHSLRISMDLHGILAIVWTPAYSVAYICVCCPPKRLVYNIPSSSLLHRKYLLRLCCLLKSVAVSASADRQPLSTLSRASPSISVIEAFETSKSYMNSYVSCLLHSPHHIKPILMSTSYTAYYDY